MSERGDAAFVVLHPNTAREIVVGVDETLSVGRECAGIDERHRLLIPDESVSRNHLEIRVDLDGGRAWLVDTSSNGTLLNGAPATRGMAVPLRPGDRLTVGSAQLEFRSDRLAN
jgi:adenylate cyclase